MGSKKTLPLYYPYNPPISAIFPANMAVPLAVTGTNTYLSPSTFVANLDNIGCQVIFTGTPTGTLTLFISNDNIDFDSLTFDTLLPQPSGADLKYGISLNQLPWAYLQFQYVNTSGSGTMQVSIFGKDIN